MRRNAFTLIELLVVVSIIVLLIAMLLPAMGRARFVSRNVVCTSNTRQQATAFTSYATDFIGFYPTADHRDKNGLPKGNGSNWDKMQCLYVMCNPQGRELSQRGFATDNPDVWGDPVPATTIMHCPFATGMPRGFLTYKLLHIDQYIILTDLKSAPGYFKGKYSPARAGDRGPITACQTQIAPAGNLWAGYHLFDSRVPEGLSQSSADGSAQWTSADELPVNGNDIPLPLYNSGWPWNWTWLDQ